MRCKVEKDYTELAGTDCFVYCILPEKYAEKFNLTVAAGICLINLDSLDTRFELHSDFITIRRVIQGKDVCVVANYLELYGLYQFTNYRGRFSIGEKRQYRDLPKQKVKTSIGYITIWDAANDD